MISDMEECMKKKCVTEFQHVAYSLERETYQKIEKSTLFFLKLYAKLKQWSEFLNLFLLNWFLWQRSSSAGLDFHFIF